MWQDHDRPFPCKVHARLEACEEADSDPEQAQDTLIAFDAVSANRIDSRQESFFAVDEDIERRVKDYWKRMFGGWRSDMPDDYYESVPSLLVELSLPASDSRIRPLREFGDRWAAFDLGESGMRDIDVFRDRFDLEPVVARISDAPKSVLGQLSKQLSTVCDMGCWPDPGASRLDRLLSSLRRLGNSFRSMQVKGRLRAWISSACACRVAMHWISSVRLPIRATNLQALASVTVTVAIRFARAAFPACYIDLGCGVSKILQSGGSMLLVQGGIAPVTWSGCREAVTSHWEPGAAVATPPG